MGETSSLFKRLIGAWNDIAGSVTGSTKVSPDLSSQDDAESLREQMVACLEARGGEVSARARAAALGQTYLELAPEGRQRFLRIVGAAIMLEQLVPRRLTTRHRHLCPP